MVLVPEELHRQLLAKNARPPNTDINTLAESTPNAQEIHYITAERRRRKYAEDAVAKPLLVDFPAKTKESIAEAVAPKVPPTPPPPSANAKKRKKRKTKNEANTSASSLEPKAVVKEALETPKTSPAKSFEPDDSTELVEPVGLEKRVQHILKALLDAKLVDSNGKIIKGGPSGGVYKSSNAVDSIKYIIQGTSTNRSPDGTEKIRAFVLNANKQQTGQGCLPLGSFRAKLWPFSNGFMSRPSRHPVSQAHKRS
jgi:hypothetical protein